MEFGHGLPVGTKVSCPVEEGGACLNQGESRHPCFALIEDFKRLYYSSDASLNDIIRALRVFLNTQGDSHIFRGDFQRPRATPIRTWQSANSSPSFDRLREQIPQGDKTWILSILGCSCRHRPHFVLPQMCTRLTCSPPKAQLKCLLIGEPFPDHPR